MNEGELRTKAKAPSEACVEGGPQAAARPPLAGVVLLLPVWGFRFVSQFLEFCLPTLLAPGNIPAVAAALPCRFVLLSSEADEPVIRSHPAWQQLERICTAEVRSIEDLITDGNHSATITLAFARAVRESGAAMLDTCFIFLVSDYLVADGSLRSVVERIRGGASGVIAGNYQIIAEDAIPLLRRQVDPASPAIVLPPRDLVRWSLAHLHPATVANIVNFGLSHNAHTNRLFWRVDEDTLIGRFYLMHMIGIRPEVEDFVVGASCDYSFIPEMCPSGNVATLTDSDEYLVLEMQPRDHEIRNLLPGPLDAGVLARSLAEWATAQQRRNVEHTLVYHAGDVPETLPKFVAEADAFVDRARALLTGAPHPHRHHHYWIGSIAVNRARTRRPLSRQDWEFLLGEAQPSGGAAGFLWRLRTRVLGSLPDVTRVHPRWPDFGLPLRALRQVVSRNGRLLLVAPQPAAYAQWLTRAAGEIETVESARLLELPRDLYLPLVGTFDACVMILTEGQLPHTDELIAAAGPLLKPGGQIMIMVTNDRSLEHAAEFTRAFVHHSARLLNPSAWLAEVHYVPASRLRWSIYRAMNRVALRGGIAGWRSPRALLALALFGAPLSLASFLCNLAARTSSSPPAGLWSSVFLILRRAPHDASPPLPEFRRSSVEIQSLAFRDSAPSTPQSERWRKDPSSLARVLARYRFVAGLLSPRHDVAEYGVSEVLGPQLILRKVQKIAVYDADPFRIAEMMRSVPADWPLEARVHDILTGPLPKSHDSIYSLDTIQYVSRSDEHIYARHLSDSLSRDEDVLIVGSPSPGALEIERPRGPDESPAAIGAARLGLTSPALLPGHGAPAARLSPPVVLRTAAELRALFERHFRVVFSFSMVDNVVHSGVLGAADYVFALCCHRTR